MHSTDKRGGPAWTLAADRMNALHIGTLDPDWLLQHTTQPFLLVDDGPIADHFLAHKRARIFDPERHHFNPLANTTEEKAWAIAEVLYAADPGGENTLTVRNGKQALAEMLVTTTRLDKLHGDSKDPAQAEALRTVRSVTFFPLMTRVLCTGRQFDFSGSVVAKVDRAKLGEKQALTLALLLIGQHQGHIVVPDGTYLRDMHMSLLRQSRLTVGARSLSELPDTISIRDFDTVWGQAMDEADALTLATRFGLRRGLEGHTDFVEQRMAR